MKKIFTLFVFSLLSFLFIPASVHAEGIFTGEKLITVDLGAQQLTAWQDGQIKHQTKISSGMRLTPTVKGSFRIWAKVPMQDMRGPSPYKDIYPSGRYLVKNVPHVLYFHQGYAIHGAYWHNNFGRVASHGCVNTPLASAAWLFNFADKGTRVEVY